VTWPACDHGLIWVLRSELLHLVHCMGHQGHENRHACCHDNNEYYTRVRPKARPVFASSKIKQSSEMLSERNFC
jgi:hypothetical protein